MTRELDLIGISREDSVFFVITFLIFFHFLYQDSPDLYEVVRSAANP